MSFVICSTSAQCDKLGVDPELLQAGADRPWPGQTVFAPTFFASSSVVTSSAERYSAPICSAMSALKFGFFERE